MFGFSLPKLIFTILIVVVVIYGFKAISRLQDRRQAASRNAAAPDTAGRASAKRDSGAEDMVACTACGTFVMASGARSCGREDCPYPG